MFECQQLTAPVIIRRIAICRLQCEVYAFYILCFRLLSSEASILYIEIYSCPLHQTVRTISISVLFYAVLSFTLRFFQGWVSQVSMFNHCSASLP